MSFDLRNSRLALAGGLLMVVGGALAVGCGGSDSEYPFPNQESYCSALAEVQCKQKVVEACYGSDQSSLETDTRSCISVRSSPSRCNPSGLPYHPAAAEKCLQVQDVVWNDAQLDRVELSAIEDACIGVFTKGAGDGASCTLHTDCDAGDGLRCLFQNGSETGVCHIPKRVAAGEKCTDPASLCNDGYHCDAGGHCVANPEVGEACGAALPCSDGLRCGENDTCVAKLDNGSPCTVAEDCANDFCTIASGSTNGVCSSTSQLLITSESCVEFRN